MVERMNAARAEEGSPRTWRIELHGDLDLQSAPALTTQLEELAGDQAVLVIVSLASVTFLDSSGLRALVHGARCWRRRVAASSSRAPRVPSPGCSSSPISCVASPTGRMTPRPPK